MKVTNINGTSEYDCSCGSWLKHWEKFNAARQSKPYFCPACGLSIVEVGAHVKNFGSFDDSWYIVPLCRSCNNQSSNTILDVGNCALAPASRASTCGY